MALSDHWPLTDGSGTTASNLIRANNYGILVGSPTWITDSPNGGGLHFGGGAGYWNVSPCEARYVGMDYVTTRNKPGNWQVSNVITCWFRVPEGMASGGPILALHWKQGPDYTGVQPGDEYRLSPYGSGEQAYVDPEGYLHAVVFSDYIPSYPGDPGYAFYESKSAARVDDGSWHFLVMRVCLTPSNSYSFSVFVDGAKVAEMDPVLPFQDSEFYWHFGGVASLFWSGTCTAPNMYPGLSSLSTPQCFYGDITDVRYYNSCVSDDDILSLVRVMPAETGAYVLSGGPTNVLKPGAFDVTGNPIAVGLSMAAQTAAYVVDGQPARLIADVVTPPEVEPNPIWFSCNT